MNQFADWLEFYAHSLEINVWLSSPATSVRQDPVTKEWTVVVRRGDTGKERTFHPAHVILALGLAAGVTHIPEVPGMVRIGYYQP
jgi:cation diffusion facilitator CzcD-associated flavoprotein CzcO